MRPEELNTLLRRTLNFEANRSINKRLNIICYELGDVNKQVVYSQQFPDYSRGELKIALAELITMINALCIDLGEDFDSLREFGISKLAEDYKRFEERGWRENNVV